MTKKYLESLYSELCAQLGDVVYKIEQLEAQRADLRSKLKDLNANVEKFETFERLLRSQSGEASKQKETIVKSANVVASPQLLGTNNHEGNN